MLNCLPPIPSRERKLPVFLPLYTFINIQKMSKDNVHSDSENSQSKESHVQDEDYWELEISDEQKVCCLLDCWDCVFYINSSNILL